MGKGDRDPATHLTDVNVPVARLTEVNVPVADDRSTSSGLSRRCAQLGAVNGIFSASQEPLLALSSPITSPAFWSAT